MDKCLVAQKNEKDQRLNGEKAKASPSVRGTQGADKQINKGIPFI